MTIWSPGSAGFTWIEASGELSVVRQCYLAGVARATVYAQRRWQRSRRVLTRVVPICSTRSIRIFCAACRSHGPTRSGVVISPTSELLGAFDNVFVERLWRTVKYEDIYLKGYADLSEVTLGLAEYFLFYNEDRPHMALANETQAKFYRTRLGGGVSIVDKYGQAAKTSSQPIASGQRCSSAIAAKAVA